MDILNWIVANKDGVFGLATALVTAASLIANFVNPGSNNKVIAAIGTLIHTLALNFNVTPKPANG